MDFLAPYLRRVDGCLDEMFAVYSKLVYLYHYQVAVRARHADPQARPVAERNIGAIPIPAGTLREESRAISVQDKSIVQPNGDLSRQSSLHESTENKDIMMAIQGSLNDGPLLRNPLANGQLDIVRTDGREAGRSQAYVLARTLRKSVMKGQISNQLPVESNTTANDSVVHFNRGETLKEAQVMCNSLAAKILFNNQNPGYYLITLNGLGHSLAEINLHNLQIPEAVEYTKEHLCFCRVRGVKRTEIITGKGNHSKDGIPKLKPALMEFLASQQNVKVKKHKWNSGRLVVQIQDSE